MERMLSIILALFAFSANAVAAVSMHHIFSDNMVLQRNTPIKIWGKSAKNAEIKIELLGKNVSARANDKGEWSVDFPASPTCKTGTELNVFENGKKAKTFKNVLLGEVWLIAGQSNMEYTIKGYGKNARNFDADNVLARADKAMIRVSNGGEWKVMSKDVMQRFSMIGFYFAEQLSKDLDTPVGLIKKAMGGAAMIAFIPKSEMEKSPYLKEKLADWEKKMVGFDYKKAKADYEAKKAKYKADVAAKRPATPVRWEESPSPNSVCPAQFTPESIYNSMKNFAPYTIKGALWYQGESDAGEPAVSHFAEQLNLMIEVWRKDFRNAKLPFFQVMLTSFETKENWAKAREGQMRSAMESKTGIVNILDLGKKHDIHPPKKEPVATRLERAVLRDVYGKKEIPQNFVTFAKADFNANLATLELSQKRDIKLKGELRGIEVRTENSDKWQKPTSAELKDNKLIIRADDKICGVRYLWKNYPQDEVCLWLDDDSPLFPFNLQKK